MKKRKTTEILKEIYTVIKENPDITLSQLERKIRTNPAYLKEHCECLQWFKLIKIEKDSKTTKLRVVK